MSFTQTRTTTSNHSEYVYYQGSTSLDHSANQTNGNAVGGANVALAIGYLYLSAASAYINYRSFLSFDLSNIPVCEIESATLILTRYNTSANDFDIYIVASEASDDVGTSDYQDGITGASGFPFTDDVTLYKDSAWTVGGTSQGDIRTTTLNSNALSDIKSAMGSGKFKLALLNTYDYNDTYTSLSAVSAFVIKGPMFYSTQDSTTTNHPQLRITTKHTSFKISADTSFKGGNHTIK